MSAHGGAIALESEEGCGAKFRILLPVPAKPVAVAAVKPVSEDVWHGKGTILVVDDEKDSLLMAKKVLESAGYSVLTAEDGAEAIKVYRNNSDTVSVVILDLVMPHVRGDEAAKEIRRIRDDVSILLLSGYHEIDLTEMNWRTGEDRHFRKAVQDYETSWGGTGYFEGLTFNTPENHDDRNFSLAGNCFSNHQHVIRLYRIPKPGVACSSHAGGSGYLTS